MLRFSLTKTHYSLQARILGGRVGCECYLSQLTSTGLPLLSSRASGSEGKAATQKESGEGTRGSARYQGAGVILAEGILGNQLLLTAREIGLASCYFFRLSIMQKSSKFGMQMLQVYPSSFYWAMGAREKAIEMPGKSGSHLSLRTF